MSEEEEEMSGKEGGMSGEKGGNERRERGKTVGGTNGEEPGGE